MIPYYDSLTIISFKSIVNAVSINVGLINRWFDYKHSPEHKHLIIFMFSQLKKQIYEFLSTYNERGKNSIDQQA